MHGPHEIFIYLIFNFFYPLYYVFAEETVLLPTELFVTHWLRKTTKLMKEVPLQICNANQ